MGSRLNAPAVYPYVRRAARETARLTSRTPRLSPGNTHAIGLKNSMIPPSLPIGSGCAAGLGGARLFLARHTDAPPCASRTLNSARSGPARMGCCVQTTAFAHCTQQLQLLLTHAHYSGRMFPSFGRFFPCVFYSYTSIWRWVVCSQFEARQYSSAEPTTGSFWLSAGSRGCVAISISAKRRTARVFSDPFRGQAYNRQARARGDASLAESFWRGDLIVMFAPWPAVLDVARRRYGGRLSNLTPRPSSRLTAGLAVAPRPDSDMAADALVLGGSRRGSS